MYVIKTQHLQFLDIKSDLATNYECEQFVNAHKYELEKGFRV
jgi:hypothetical protein